MREGVLVLDQEGRMLLVNPALRATLGLPAETEGRAALELIRNADLPSILERARSAGPVTGEIETTGPRSRRLLVHAAKLIGSGVKPVVACRSSIAEALTDDAEMLAAVHELSASVF